MVFSPWKRWKTFDNFRFAEAAVTAAEESGKLVTEHPFLAKPVVFGTFFEP